MKTMSNLLHHKGEDDRDGSSSSSSSSGGEKVNAVRDVSARGTAVIMVVMDRRRRACRIGSS